MIAGLVVVVLLFLALVWQVQTGGALVVLDGIVNAGLAPLRTRAVLAAFGWIAQLGTGGAGAVVSLVASGLLWSDGRIRFVLPLWVAFAGAQVTTWSLKFITARVRPPFLEGVTAASPSFPSAHATVSMAVYGFLALVIAQGVPQGRGVVMAIGALLILLICLSRLILSLHYLTDVVAGALVGLAWVMLGWALARL